MLAVPRGRSLIRRELLMRTSAQTLRTWFLASCACASLAALTSCKTTPKARDYEPVLARFLMEAPAQDTNAQVVELPRSGVKIPVSPRIAFSEADVANVELVHVDLGLCLMFEFTPDAARSLMRVTGSNLGRRLVVTLNGRAFGARMIDTTFTDGRLMIFVELSDDELTATAVNLKRTAQEVQAAVAGGRKH